MKLAALAVIGVTRVKGSAAMPGTTPLAMAHPELARLDMSGDDESIVRWRLDEEIPALMLSGTRYIVVALGDRPRLRRSTGAAIGLAHRELRAVRGRLVVITNQVTAGHCNRACPDLLVAASVREADSALGLISVHPAAAAVSRARH